MDLASFSGRLEVIGDAVMAALAGMPVPLTGENVSELARQLRRWGLDAPVAEITSALHYLADIGQVAIVSTGLGLIVVRF